MGVSRGCPMGLLRPVVERVLRESLKCGLLEHIFARLRCSQCRRSVLVAFFGRGRSFCPSCEKKKQLLGSGFRAGGLASPLRSEDGLQPRRLAPWSLPHAMPASQRWLTHTLGGDTIRCRRYAASAVIAWRQAQRGRPKSIGTLITDFALDQSLAGCLEVPPNVTSCHPLDWNVAPYSCPGHPPPFVTKIQ